MVDIDKIAELVKNPSLISNEQLDELLNYSIKHSYSPIFSILYLKGMSKFNQLDFEDVLKEHAYKIPSRERLFCLIHESKEKANDLVQEPFIEAEKELEIEPETPLKEEPIIEKTPLEVVEPKIVPEPDSEPEITKKQETDPLEKEILAHAINSSISSEIEDTVNYKLTRNTRESSDLLSDEEDKIEETNKTEEVKTTSSDKKSFSQWMSAYITEESTPSTSSNIKDEHLEGGQNIKFEENNLKVEEKNKSKKEFFSPTKKAKESLDESALPVSETLAKIYGLQGNIPKAISAYQQLMLKIPEKKSFFALRIEELKKNLNK